MKTSKKKATASLPQQYISKAFVERTLLAFWILVFSIIQLNRLSIGCRNLLTKDFVSKTPFLRQLSPFTNLVILKELDCVKIIRLLESECQYDGTEGVKRAPQIGDVGTIVHVYATDGKTAGYIVESVNTEGYTIWLTDFLAEEIQSNN